jgi:hypothetical protein
MKTTLHLATALSVLLIGAAPLAAQQPPSTPEPATEAAAPADDPKVANAPPDWLKERPITMQHFRPLDRRGINIFETPKEPGVEYTGFKLDWGAAFTSQVQSLSHSNSAAPNMVNNVNANQLADIGFGFNNSTANLYLNAQIAKASASR